MKCFSNLLRGACFGLAVLAGCAAPVPGDVRLYRLNAAPPLATPAVPATAATASNWQLMQPVAVPAYLDRDALLLPQGPSGVLALSRQRWAEPLRDSVPRLLRQDLAALLGEARVWTTPLPAGVVIARQLRVELLALEATPDGSAVLLRARWSLADVAGAAPPRAEAVSLTVPSAGADVDSLVTAHRLALWRLAERIVATP
jgi:uncharacterized protein